MELLFGLLHEPANTPVWFKVGAGPGLTHGWGTPDFRVFATVGGQWRGKAPEPRDKPEKKPESDCPYEGPEDIDGHEDDDGCPDPDNDGDGVPDVRDGPRRVDGGLITDPEHPEFGACMNDAEDKDGHHDTDGCPDPDNDGDGIPDTRDGHRVGGRITPANGYPNFGDCMNDAETYNGVDDNDGCPDKALAEFVDGEIVIFDKVYFDFDLDRIKPSSYPVLDAVVTILKAYPVIERIEVQGHTDDRGTDAYNLDLSPRRAAAVMNYLMNAGISADRLSSRGYGESANIIPGAQTEEEHARNRRVQFVITRMGADAPSVRDVDAARPPPPEGPQVPYSPDDR
jgi:outer membrane protein OmpA-like peptidoglycan-associated protein